MSETAEQLNIVEYAAEIVAAYVSNNTVAASDLGALIGDIHQALVGLAKAAAEPVPLVPAVPVKSSVKKDHIVCLEDGQKYKTLKRHLRVHHNMSPQEYRAKWNLQSDYPIVAPSYSEQRSQVAKSLGLGQKGRAAALKSAGSSSTRGSSKKGATRSAASKATAARSTINKKSTSRARKLTAKI